MIDSTEERNIDVIIRSMEGKVASLRVQTEKAESVLSGFVKIKKVDGANPIDPDTGQTMTDDRREEIYDKCLPVAEEILGINQP